MKALKIGVLGFVAVGLAIWFFDEPASTLIPIHPVAPSVPGSHLTKPAASIKLPQNISRTTASDVLSNWWSAYSATEAARYSVDLIEKSSQYELYQVYYLGRRVELLTIRRELVGTQEITPLTPYTALDENDVMSSRDVEKNIRAKDDKITDVVSEGKVWAIGPNRTLYPAYKYSVTIQDADTTQVWIANAKTGEITSINTFSRN